MTTEDAKAYLAQREIPQLFESLMTGLMFYRPEDHIAYLQECLKRLKSEAVDKVRWNLFIESRKKTPLPPILPSGEEKISGVGGRSERRGEKIFATDDEQNCSRQNSSSDNQFNHLQSSSKNHEDSSISKPVDRSLSRGRNGSDSDKSISVQSRASLSEDYDLEKPSSLRSGRKLSSPRESVRRDDTRPYSGKLKRLDSTESDVRPKSNLRKGSSELMKSVSSLKSENYNFDVEYERPVSGRSSTGSTKMKAAKVNGSPNLSVSSQDRHQESKMQTHDEKASLASIFRQSISSASLRSGRNTPIDIEEICSRRESPKSLDEKRGSPLPPIDARDYPSGTGLLKLPKCPIVLCMGGPGCGKKTQCDMLLKRYPGWAHLSMGDELRKNMLQQQSNEKWNVVSQLVQKGELAPDEMTGDLIANVIKENMNAKGLIIEGYPRTMEQVKEFNELIGRVDLVFVLDCEEQYLQNRLAIRLEKSGRIDDNENAVEERVKFFKEKTLPVIKYFDDQGKLAVIDGDRDGDEIFYDLALIFDNVFQRQDDLTSTRLGGDARKGSGFARVDTLIDIAVKDTGRKPGLPTCPIIFMMGGPGSGRTGYSKKLVERCPDYLHVNMGEIARTSSKAQAEIAKGNIGYSNLALTALKEAFQKVDDKVSAIILDGFPRCKEQFEEFNKEIGGLDYAVLIDCEADFMRKNVDKSKPNSSEDAIKQRISFFKYETLPLLGYLDDHNKLAVINGERDTNKVFSEVCQQIERFLFKAKRPSSSMLANAPPSTRIDPPDTGRKPGLITCPFFAITGSPGCYENIVKKVAEKYPKYGHVKMGGKEIKDLLAELGDHSNAEGLIIENFPINQRSTYEFNTTIGGLGLAVVLDCSEEFAKKKASAEAVEEYKRNTLGVLSYYDDRNKLEYIDLESQTEEQVISAICKAIDDTVERGPVLIDADGCAVVPIFSAKIPDTGRKSGLPTCQIVSIVSGPGSGADQVCQKLAAKYAGSVHLQASNMTADDIVQKLSGDGPTFLECFPKDGTQANQFNEKIGGISGVILLDTSAEFSREKGGDSSQIRNYQMTTLPVLGYYDDQRLLHQVNGEQSIEQVFEDVCKIVDKILSQSPKVSS